MTESMKPLKYLLYPPEGEAQTAYPLIIFLHGIGERGDDLELVKKWGLPQFSRNAAKSRCPPTSPRRSAPPTCAGAMSSTNLMHAR